MPTVLQGKMHLTDNDIALIAKWTPIDKSFAVNVDKAVALVLQHIKDSATYTHNVFEDGGYSNYVGFLVCHSDDLIHRPCETYRSLNPVAVYLSSYAPFAVIGRIHASYGTVFCGVGHLDLEKLIDPSSPDTDLERFVLHAIAGSPFTLLSPDEVKRPLPSGLQPAECHDRNEGWGTYFDALFARAD